MEARTARHLDRQHLADGSAQQQGARQAVRARHARPRRDADDQATRRDQEDVTALHADRRAARLGEPRMQPVQGVHQRGLSPAHAGHHPSDHRGAADPGGRIAREEEVLQRVQDQPLVDAISAYERPRERSWREPCEPVADGRCRFGQRQVQQAASEILVGGELGEQRLDVS
jgi:hypothetical protein